MLYRIVVMILFLPIFLTDVYSAEISVVESGNPKILLNGVIEKGDSEKLRRAIDSVPQEYWGDTGEVVLNSPGGLFSEGINIGMTIHEKGWGTRVVKGSSCMSACAFAFLGGRNFGASSGWFPVRNLEVGATLGFHSFYVETDQLVPADQGVEAGRISTNRLYAYATQLRISPEIIIHILTKNKDEFVIANTPYILKNLDVNVLGFSQNFDTTVTKNGAINISINTLNPREDDWELSPRAEVITPDQFMKEMLLPLAENLRPAKDEQPGELAKVIINGANSNDTKKIRKIYGEACRIGIVPHYGDLIFKVSGLNNVHYYRSKTAYVLPWNSNSKNISISCILASPIDLGGGYTEKKFTKNGDVFYDMHSPHERLW